MPEPPERKSAITRVRERRRAQRPLWQKIAEPIGGFLSMRTTPEETARAEEIRAPIRRAATAVAEPLAAGIQAGGEAVEDISKNIGATVLSPATISSEERLAIERGQRPGRTLQETRKAYEETEMPWGVKGAAETLPLMAIPAAATTQRTLQAVKAGGALGKAAKVGAALLTPAVVAEEAVAAPFVAGASAIQRAIQRRAARKAAQQLTKTKAQLAAEEAIERPFVERQQTDRALRQIVAQQEKEAAEKAAAAKLAAESEAAQVERMAAAQAAREAPLARRAEQVAAIKRQAETPLSMKAAYETADYYAPALVAERATAKEAADRQAAAVTRKSLSDWEASNREPNLAPEHTAALAEQEAYGRGDVTPAWQRGRPVVEAPAPVAAPAPVMEPPKPPIKTGVAAPAAKEVTPASISVEEFFGKEDWAKLTDEAKRRFETGLYDLNEMKRALRQGTLDPSLVKSITTPAPVTPSQFPFGPEAKTGTAVDQLETAYLNAKTTLAALREKAKQGPMTPSLASAITRENGRAKALGIRLSVAKQAKALPAKGIPPTVKGPGAATLAGRRIQLMFEDARRQSPRDWFDTFRSAWERVWDTTYGLRRVTPHVKKAGVNVEPGGLLDVEAAINAAPGAPRAGLQRAVTTLKAAQEAAPDVLSGDISAIVYANHGKSVLLEKGPQRVMGGGFTDPAEFDTELATLAANLGPDKWARAQRAAEIVKERYAAERVRMVAGGRISAETAQEWADKYPWYNPLRYGEDAEALAKQGRTVGAKTVVTQGLYRLTEEGTLKPAIDALTLLPDQLIKNEAWLARNRSARTIVEALLRDPMELGKVTRQSSAKLIAVQEGEEIWRASKEEIKDTLSFFVDGKRHIYQVPHWAYREAVELATKSEGDFARLVGFVNGLTKAGFTTFSPSFVFANMANDIPTALFRANVLPWQTAKRIIGSMKGIENDKIREAFVLAGGLQARFVERNAALSKAVGLSSEADTRYVKKMAKELGVEPDKVIRSGPSFMRRVKDAIPMAGEMGEQGPRLAYFENYLNKQLPQWQKMTAEEIAATNQARAGISGAVEATINWARGGYLVKSVNPFVLFLNAAMEGMKVPARALMYNPKAKWTIATALTGYTGVMSYNLSYPEYFDVPNDIRWGSILIMLPSKEKDQYGKPKPNYVTIIPRTREWALFFGPLAYTMERVYSDVPDGFAKFAGTIGAAISPINEIPAPQVLLEIFQQNANWDFYRKRPIVDEALEELPAEQQTAPWVSRTVEAAANAVRLSPIRAQHALSSLAGGAGRSAVSVTDFIIDILKPVTVDPHIRSLAERYEKLDSVIARNKFLMNVTLPEKDAMFAYLRRPTKKVPIVQPIIERFVPPQSGQMYRTGQTKAAALTGISPQQTRQTTLILRRVSDQQNEHQKAYDRQLAAGQIAGSKWREKRSDLAKEYQGALKALGIQFPGAAQVQKDPSAADAYYKAIVTAGYAMPDARERAEVLAAGWYAINLQETEPGTPDWNTFFGMREQYKASLNMDDRLLLNQYLVSKMTPTEAAYDRDAQLLRPYWEIADQVWAQPGFAEDPNLKNVAAEIERLQGGTKEDQYKAKLLATRNIKATLGMKLIAREKVVYKRLHPEVDGLLRKWY